MNGRQRGTVKYLEEGGNLGRRLHEAAALDKRSRKFVLVEVLTAMEKTGIRCYTEE